MNAAMYLSDLSGIPEWNGFGGDGAVNQSAVDARWALIGQGAPAPIVPATLIGLYVMPTRVGPRVALTRNIKNLRKSPSAGFFTPQENDFWNFFTKVAIDPYHKQSGLSKIAGGILKVADTAIPAFSYFEAAAAAANIAAARGKQGADERLATRVMEPAYTQAAAQTQAKEDAAFSSQMKLLQSLAPTAAPLAFDTQSAAPLVTEPATIKKSSSPPLPWLVAGGLLLLGVALS